MAGPKPLAPVHPGTSPAFARWPALVAPITCGNWGGTRAEVHLDNIRKFIQHQLPIEYYWIDAEWYRPGQLGGERWQLAGQA